MNLLIIEDDIKIANYSKEGFEEENFVVDLARNGEDGLKLIEKKSYDIVILDWMLPGIDGIEVCKKIREVGLTTPIIMLTAKVYIEDRIRGLESGADDYVLKPFYFEELLARANALVRRANYQSDDIIKIDNLTLNIRNREVFRGKNKIELTAKEYDILELLVKNRGQIVRLKTIIKEAWKNDETITSNIVNVYMHHLRRKIDDGYSEKLIKTVRKRGFKIDIS